MRPLTPRPRSRLHAVSPPPAIPHSPPNTHRHSPPNTHRHMAAFRQNSGIDASVDARITTTWVPGSRAHFWRRVLNPTSETMQHVRWAAALAHAHSRIPVPTPPYFHAPLGTPPIPTPPSPPTLVRAPSPAHLRTSPRPRHRTLIHTPSPACASPHAIPPAMAHQHPPLLVTTTRHCSPLSLIPLAHG